MKSFRDILAEGKIIEVIEGATPKDAKKIKAILDGAEVKYKQQKNAFRISFADKLQKQIVDSALSHDRKITLK